MNSWRTERTGWRDQAISQRHGHWGFNCPCVDLDFVVAEFNHGLPVALIEYKERHARPPDIGHPTYQALKALADGYKGGALPFLIATYCRENWWFRVLPINAPAKAAYSQYGGAVFTEQQFVRSLHLMRKKALSAKDELAIAQLNDVLPSQAESPPRRDFGFPPCPQPRQRCLA